MTIPSQVTYQRSHVQPVASQYDNGLEARTQVPESAGVFTDIVFADHLPQERVPTPAETYKQELADARTQLFGRYIRQASAAPLKRTSNGTGLKYDLAQAVLKMFTPGNAKQANAN